jgi:co-chaperonin GroES (HSP10)
MINQEFIQETDCLINRIQARKVRLQNGNVLVAKVKTDRVTAGGLYLSDTTTEKEDYKSGFARILALPETVDEQSPSLTVGDYVLHSHEARYQPYPPSLREVLDYLVEDKFIYAIQDNEVILTIASEDLKHAIK